MNIHACSPALRVTRADVIATHTQKPRTGAGLLVIVENGSSLEKAFALGPLASQLARTAHSFSALTRLLLRRLFKVGPAFHFPEEPLALHFLLQRAQGLFDIIVADDDLYDGSISICSGGETRSVLPHRCSKAAPISWRKPVAYRIYDMTRSPSNLLRDKWLEAFLPEVAFDGWTGRAARHAANAAGLSEAEQALAAPSGVPDLIAHFFNTAQEHACTAIETADLSTLRVHEKVAFGVRAWLDAMETDREAVRRAVNWGALPWRAGAPAQRAWSVADMIWTAIGDTSQDYNRYTKRGLLASALPSIVLNWLDETDSEAIDAHIASRLKRAMQFGQAGAKIAGPFLRPFAKPEKEQS